MNVALAARTVLVHIYETIGATVMSLLNTFTHTQQQRHLICLVVWSLSNLLDAGRVDGQNRRVV
jgi:hypothetical protein